MENKKVVGTGKAKQKDLIMIIDGNKSLSPYKIFVRDWAVEETGDHNFSVDF